MKHDHERAVASEAAFATIRDGARKRKQAGELPRITRESTGAWCWWAKFNDRIVSGLSANKRQAANDRRKAEIMLATEA